MPSPSSSFVSHGPAPRAALGESGTFRRQHPPCILRVCLPASSSIPARYQGRLARSSHVCKPMSETAIFQAVHRRCDCDRAQDAMCRHVLRCKACGAERCGAGGRRRRNTVCSTDVHMHMPTYQAMLYVCEKESPLSTAHQLGGLAVGSLTRLSSSHTKTGSEPRISPKRTEFEHATTTAALDTALRCTGHDRTGLRQAIMAGTCHTGVGAATTSTLLSHQLDTER